jgi:DNA-binding NarL/FixJ family response regulator
MRPIKVILADGSRLPRELLKRVIEKTEGLQVILEVDQLDHIEETVDLTTPDWLIVPLPSVIEIPDSLERLIQRYPHLRVAVVSVDGDQVRMKWVEHHDESLHDLSWNDLIGIFRSKVERTD